MRVRPLGMAIWGIAVVALGAAPEVPEAQDEDKKIKVSFQGVPLENLATMVERATKKSFLYQEALLKNKKVTLQSEKPLAPDEFYRVFQTICHMNGLALVPVEEENINLVKIVQSQQAQKEPGAQPVLTQGEALPNGDSLLFYLLTPKHIPAAKAMTVLSTGISATGVLQQIAETELILVIDVATAIRRAEKILALVDVPGAPTRSVRMTLEFLPAMEAQIQLSAFLQAFAKAGGPPSKLVMLPDERLNSLYLIGPEDEVKKAEEFLKEIDQDLPPARRTVQYYKIKNVSVLDIVDTVRQLLGLAVAAREAAEEGARSGGPPPSPLAGRPTMPLAGQPRPPQTPPHTQPQEGTQAPPARIPRAQTMQQSLLGGAGGGFLPPDVEVVPIENLNVLVVIGKQSVHEEVGKILENLDKRKSQILMEVAIIQVTGDDSLDYGIEFLQEDTKGDGAVVSGGTGFGLGDQVDGNTSGFPEAHELTGFTGGAFRYIKPDDISVLIRALSTKSNVNILSQPLLLVADNETGDFSTRVSEPTVAVSQGTATTTTSFAGFAEAVTSLKITPQVSPDGYINLRITQSFEEFTGSAQAAGVPPPKVSSNVTSVVTVPDRHTVILGGFTRDATQDTRTGIPLIKDIPIIGSLTSHTTTSVTKSRLYLFVRPRVLSQNGFQDLKSTSREKVGDLRTFTRGSRIQDAIDKAFGSPAGPRVKQAGIPFGIRKEKR